MRVAFREGRRWNVIFWTPQNEPPSEDNNPKWFVSILMPRNKTHCSENRTSSRQMIQHGHTIAKRLAPPSREGGGLIFLLPQNGWMVLGPIAPSPRKVKGARKNWTAGIADYFPRKLQRKFKVTHPTRGGAGWLGFQIWPVTSKLSKKVTCPTKLNVTSSPPSASNCMHTVHCKNQRK